MGPILKGYGTMDIKFKIHESCGFKNLMMVVLSSVFFAFIHHVFHGNPWIGIRISPLCQTQQNSHCHLKMGAEPAPEM
jgi:hypothetical protein